MFKRLQQSDVVTAIMCLMLTALFISRAVLSISIMLFVAVALWYGRKQLWPPGGENRVIIILFALLFFLPFLSGLWSDDAGEWWRRCRVKLPLLLLPAALAVTRLNAVQLYAVQLLFVFCVLGGTVYSMFEYLLQPAHVEAGYDTASVMPTLIDNDHIRFSWLVVLAILLLLQIQPGLRLNRQRIINGALMAWLVVYLHILSAKTGLLMLYTVLPLYGVYRLRKSGKKWWWGIVLLFVVLPFIAYKTIPTFKKRIDYIRYDFSHYARGEYREGLSDAARIYSLKAGRDIWCQQPVTGIGFGDIDSAAQQWYRTHTPFVKSYERILPSSQLLLYAAGCGVAGLLVLITALVWPAVQALRNRRFYALLFWLAAIPGFCFEIHLESQYGVFIFCFFACWFTFITKPTQPPA